MQKVTRRLLIGGGVVLAVLGCLVAVGVGMYLYVTRPLKDGAPLASGKVTTIVTDHYGPVGIAAYMLDLGAGGVGLVDAGMDPKATAINAALARLGRTTSDVRVILVTHAHNDHAGGTVAFPDAEVYALAPDVDAIRRRRNAAGAAGPTTAIKAGEVLNLFGTDIQVFAVPGHTKGSAAYVVHGVLFLGDTAQSMRDGTLGPNSMTSEDGETNTRSLRALAEDLKSRGLGVQRIAFGHSGPVDGPDPLLEWAFSAP